MPWAMSMPKLAGIPVPADSRDWPTGDGFGASFSRTANWLAFEVDGQTCAVDSRQVRSVLRPPGMAPLPGRDARCPGLLAWHDTALVVLDLGACLGLRPSLGQAASRLLVCHGHEQEQAWGLLVDAVRGFQRIASPEPGWIAVRPGLPPPWNAMFALLPTPGGMSGEVCAMLHVQTLWEGCLSLISNHPAAVGPSLPHHPKDVP